MKATQCELYAERIDRVIQHLQARTDAEESPTLGELASVAAISEFHFHRIFRLMTGETVGEVVRRIRLSRSLPDLAADLPMVRAAGSSGYATSQSFARALKTQTGTSATAARATPEGMEALAAGLLRPKQAGAGQPTALTIEVVSVDPIRVLAIRNVGAYAELNRTYARLFELVLAQVSPEALAGIYGVPYDDPISTPPERLRFAAGLAVGNEGQANGELEELQVGRGSYARLRHVGDYDRVHETIDAAYAATIISLDRAVDARPVFVHYLHDPEETPEPDLEADVYVPLV